MDRGTETNGTDYSVSPWDASGRATLRASGAGMPAAMAAALSGILAAAGVATSTGGSRSVPLRAETVTREALLVELAVALQEEQASGSAVAGVSVDGLLRTDAGWLAWGRALLGEPAGRPGVVAFAGSPEIVQGGGITTIRATVVRNPGAAS